METIDRVPKLKFLCPRNFLRSIFWKMPSCLNYIRSLSQIHWIFCNNFLKKFQKIIVDVSCVKWINFKKFFCNFCCFLYRLWLIFTLPSLEKFQQKCKKRHFICLENHFEFKWFFEEFLLLWFWEKTFRFSAKTFR